MGLQSQTGLSHFTFNLPWMGRWGEAPGSECTKPWGGNGVRQRSQDRWFCPGSDAETHLPSRLSSPFTSLQPSASLPPHKGPRPA